MTWARHEGLPKTSSFCITADSSIISLRFAASTTLKVIRHEPSWRAASCFDMGEPSRGAFGRRDILKLALATFALLSLAIPISRAADNFILVQSTTSTQNSGLFRAHFADLHEEDRNRGARGRGGHGASLEERRERRR